MSIDPAHLDSVLRLIKESMSGFLAETVLSCLIIFLLLHEVIARRSNPKVVAWITAAGFFATGICLIATAKDCFETPREIFGWKDGDVHRGLLRLDGFGLFFKMFVLLGSLVTIPMCLAHRGFQQRRMGEFYALLAASTLGMFLMASASNLLMIYLGIEFASMGSYLATAFQKQDRKASEAGLKYVIYGSVASGIMIYGLSLIYGMTGSLHLGDISAELALNGASASGFAAAAVLVFAGFAYKMAAFPMHFWCPDVYEGASVPFTAYLSVTSKAAGFAVFIRFVMAFGPGFEVTFRDVVGGADRMDFGWRTIIGAAAALSMTVGNLAALWQTNVKRMLAYSSIAQAGYLLMAVAALNPSSTGSAQMAPVLFYFIAYFFMNLCAFYVVTVVGAKVGTEDVDGYRGFGRRAPFLAACLALCLISLLGVPPTGGFTGKMQLFMAVIDAKMVWLAIVAGINTAISAYYYFKLIRCMFLDAATDPTPLAFSRPSLAMVGALALPILPLGLAFHPVSNWLLTGHFAL